MPHSDASTVLIIGFGEMGHAMHHLLGERHRVRIWERHPRDGGTPPDLQALAAESEFVFLCVPATPVAALTDQLRPALGPRQICMTFAKGLDEQGRPAAAILAAGLGGSLAHAVLYGPMIAEELRAGRPGFAQVGTAAPDIYRRINGLFSHTRLYLEQATDLIGISWSAILKNVYAIMFGVADELRLGDNMRGYLTAAALHELAAIVTRLGGDPATPLRLAGLGDLITTATSAGSHHHELGRQLVRGETQALQGEGIHTLAMIEKFAPFELAAFPLADLTRRLLQAPDGAPDKIAAYLNQAFFR